MSEQHGWPMVRLGDVCTLPYGKALKSVDRDGGQFPVFGSGGQVGSHSETNFEGPTIILGRKGSSGAVFWSESPCWIIDTAFGVDSDPSKTDKRWLYWTLRFLDLGRLQKHAAVPGISRNDVLREKISLPPLEEQRRIAGILDTSDRLSDNLSKKLEVLEDLDRSSYLTKFTAEKVVAQTQELASPNKNSIRTGPFGSQLKHDEFVDEGISVLGLDNVVSNRFRWAESRHITPEKYEQLKRYTVHPGDVLISIMGTTGRCAIVPEGIPTTINTKHICAITVNHSLMLPEFLRASFLWHPEVRQSLRQKTKGSIMAGLNMGIIKNLLLPLPDISKQQEWVSVSEKINLARHQLLKEITQVESLKVSLQTRAFQGLL